MDFAGCLASVGLVILFKDSATMLWVGSVLLGISLASIFPTFITLAEQRMHVTGAITGWFLVGGGVGGMILPVIIGNAFEMFSPNAMMYIILLTIAFDLIFLVTFTRTSRKPALVTAAQR